MKSTGLFGWKDFQFVFKDYTVSEIKDDEVVIKVHACGICGTDIHLAGKMENPTALGHEISAEIVKVGSSTSHFNVGDSVIVEDCTFCGICNQCKAGRPDLCRSMHTIDGQPGFSTYMKVSESTLVPYSGLDYLHACLTEPVTVALNSVIHSQIRPNSTVAVYGCGPLGIMTAIIAKHLGAARTVMIGRGSSNRGRARLTMAAQLGVDIIIDSDMENPVEAVKSMIPEGIERVIVSSPPTTLPKAIAIAAYGSIVTFFGIDLGEAAKVTIDIDDLIFRKITLKPYLGEPALNFSTSLDLIKRNIIPADRLISHSATLREAPELFKELASGVLPIIKAVVIP